MRVFSHHLLFELRSFIVFICVITNTFSLPSGVVAFPNIPNPRHTAIERRDERDRVTAHISRHIQRGDTATSSLLYPEILHSAPDHLASQPQDTLPLPTPFLVSEPPSPNQPTQPTFVSETTQAQHPTTTHANSIPPHIIISEIFPNPIGSDTDYEWIELWNAEQISVSLDGFTLTDASGKKFILTDYTIPARAFLILGRKETKISLNNDSDILALVYPDGTAASVVSYTSVPEGESYAIFPGGYQPTFSPTPGSENIFEEEEREEDLTDVPPTPPKQASYSTQNLPNTPPLQVRKTPVSATSSTPVLFQKIRISELMPNPDGRDEDGDSIVPHKLSSEH